MKTQHEDFYLAKSEMERNYLLRVCRVAPDRIVIRGSAKSAASQPSAGRSDQPWLVFFTEPYQTAAWRSDEVYRELLPSLSALARSCGLKLVFKLHPFESIRGHRQLLRRNLPEEEARQIGVIAGPPSPQLWQNTRFALTVQSTVALECAALGIPVFLCAWLRDPYSAYVQQYARFGIGHVLQAPEQLADVPRLLETKSGERLLEGRLWQTLDPEKLRELLSGAYSLPAAIKG